MTSTRLLSLHIMRNNVVCMTHLQETHGLGSVG